MKLISALILLLVSGCASVEQSFYYNLDTAAGHYSSWSYPNIGSRFKINIQARYTIKRPADRWKPYSFFRIEDASGENYIGIALANYEGDTYTPFIIDSSQKSEENKRGIIAEFSSVGFENEFNIVISMENGTGIAFEIDGQKQIVGINFVPKTFSISNSSGEIVVKNMTLRKR